MNPQQQDSPRQGFTIIEVVLVLAIAGLIFLMVFIALPAMQRSQRDTQRKDDVSRLSSAIVSYQSNNNGKVPWSSSDTTGNLVAGYLTKNGGTFSDPSTNENYSLTVTKLTADASSYTETLGAMVIYYPAYCDGENVKKAAQGNKSTYAIMTPAESGNRICIDNS